MTIIRQETRQARLERIFDCPNPVAWVTGSASNRVGRVIAFHLGLQGYRVVLHARHSIREGEEAIDELRRHGVEALLVKGAVEDESAIASAVNQIVGTYGRIDLLVNSAAIWDPMRLEEVTASELRRNLDANLIGSFLCAQKAGLQMVRQPSGGCIIQIGDWAIRRPYLDYSAYFPSKGAIPAMTSSLAVELATRNPRVRVNCIHPGPVMLPIEMSQDKREALARQSLLKREGSPLDVAEAVLFLAESPFVTGVELPVEGGRSIHQGDMLDATAHPSHQQS